MGGEGKGGSGGPRGLGKPLRMDLSPPEKPRTGLLMVPSAHPSWLEVREGEGALGVPRGTTQFWQMYSSLVPGAREFKETRNSPLPGAKRTLQEAKGREREGR